MRPLEADAPFQVGDWVRIKDSMYERVRIAGYWGPLGPKGARVYRIRLEKKPRLVYVDVGEDQLEHVAKESLPGE